MLPRDPNTWLWARAQELLDETERVRRRFFELAPQHPARSWEPPADIFETSDELWIVVALPGVDPQRVQVRCTARTLSVFAHRALPQALHGTRILRMELPSGQFERNLELPAGRYRLIHQNVQDGCLWLKLARLEDVR